MIRVAVRLARPAAALSGSGDGSRVNAVDRGGDGRVEIGVGLLRRQPLGQARLKLAIMPVFSESFALASSRA
jgi:hypothetical protein